MLVQNAYLAFKEEKEKVTIRKEVRKISMETMTEIIGPDNGKEGKSDNWLLENFEVAGEWEKKKTVTSE